MLIRLDHSDWPHIKRNRHLSDIYSNLKYIHVIAAAIAFGSNVAHLFWLFSVSTDRSASSEKLRVIKKIDDRLSVPAYIVAISCGVVMWIWRWPINTSWLILSAVLAAAMTCVGIRLSSPITAWRRVSAQDQIEPDRITLLGSRVKLTWGAILVGVLIVFYLMIRKPTIW